MATEKHKPPAERDPEQQVEPADVDGDVEDVEQPTYTFNPDDIVKQLPPGMCLCPMCLGMMAVVEDPPFDPRTHLCDICAGHGKLRTGSLVGGKGDHDCWACNGEGYQAALAHEPDAVPARAEQFVESAPPARDVNGRTPDDPDFDWTRVVVQSPRPAAVDSSPVDRQPPAPVG